MISEAIQAVRVEVRTVAGDLAPLAALGAGSLVLVTGLAYALLGAGDLTAATSASILVAGKVVAASLAATAVVLAALLIKPRPHDALATTSAEGLVFERGGARRLLRARAARTVCVVQEGERHAIEVEGWLSTTRLLLEDRLAAERLAGALVGRARVAVAHARVRRRADYYLFVTTCSLWVLVFACLCALPPAPVLAALLLFLALPLAVWVTIRAVPVQVIASDDGLLLLHLLGTRRIDAAEIAGARVVDDDCVEVDLRTESLRLPELVDHPRERGISAAVPPPVRLAEGMRRMMDAGARDAA